MELDRGFSLIELLLFVILGVLLVWIATIEYRLLRLTRTLRVLFAGRTGADLEQVLREYMERMDRTDEMIKQFNERATAIEERTPFTVSHVGVVRFNPFADKGGDQSFAVALLDGHSDGVVFSGLHSRADVRVYAKPIVGGGSTYPLTEEEAEAINRALTKK
jgi:type II secretory pathway pseudopilin PulG